MECGVERGGIPQKVVGSARSTACRAPASSPAMSIPTSAAGSRPTGDRTLKRPPTSGGTLERGDPVARGDLAQRAPLGSVVKTRWRYAAASERVFQPGADHEVLGHRLRRAARLADHVHQHPARIDPAERRGDRRRIDVVEHREPREELPALVVQLVPGRARSAVSSALAPSAEPPMPSTRTWSCAWPRPSANVGDLAHRLGLIGQLVEAVFACASAAADLRLHGAEAGRELGQARARQPVGAVEPVLQHPSVGQPDHATSTVSPSYAGKIPSGSCPASSACPVSCVRWVR